MRRPLKVRRPLSVGALICALFLLAGAAGAAGAAELAVGQQIAPIEASASDGSDYTSSQVLSGEKRLVLIFFRGAW